MVAAAWIDRSAHGLPNRREQQLFDFETRATGSFVARRDA